MFTKLYESLRVLVANLNITEAKLNDWNAFYKANSIHLKSIIDQCNNNLDYYETLDKGNIIEFGAICKIIPFRTFVLEDNVEKIKDRLPARIRIRQNYKGDVLFIANSTYFNTTVPEYDIKLLRDPIEPRNFDYNKFPNIVTEFLNQVNEWEAK